MSSDATTEWELSAVNGIDRKPIVLKFTKDEFFVVPAVSPSASTRYIPPRRFRECCSIFAFLNALLSLRWLLEKWNFNHTATWNPARPVQTSIRKVLWASITPAGLLSVSALVKQPEWPKGHVLLTATAWIVEGQLRKDAEDWVVKLLELAYQGEIPLLIQLLHG